MQTQTTRRTRAGVCALLAVAMLALAGCHHDQDTAAPGGGPDPQQEKAIQQNAAAQSAAIRNAPQMGTANQGGAAPGTGANHP